ncbi:MAG: GtrA family protein [Bacteroidales bacterium]|jgi:putative flippase GtrA|nr:GtrA family protein [Bacteroidales bacterium]
MLDKLVALLKKLLTPQFIRFIFVAILNTAVGWCIYAGLLLIFDKVLVLDYPYIYASLFGTILSILFNFKTYGIIVFRNRSNKLIFKFIAVYTFNYFCNIGGIALLEHWGINNYVAGAIVAIPVGFIGYVLNKIFVFKA